MAGQELIVTVDGKEVPGWQDVRVTRGVERFPSDFDFQATEVLPGYQAHNFQVGQTVEIRIGSAPVLTGYVDRVTVTLNAQGLIYNVTGRSKCQDLIDCSAEIEPWKGTKNSTTLSALATELAAPYGITVTDRTTDNPTFQTFSANLGETSWEILERVARSVGVLVYDDPLGNLVLARNLGEPDVLRGTVAVGSNVEGATITLSMDQRYATYTIVPQPVDNMYDRRHAANQASGQSTKFAVGEATDPGVTRKRRLYIVSEQFQNGVSLAQSRATWEMNRRWGRSQAMSVVTDSWFDQSGRLWQPNTLVAISAPGLKIGLKDWVVSQATYSKSIRSGTTTELVLMPPQAFEIQPTTIAPFDVNRSAAAREAAAQVRGTTTNPTQGSSQ